MNNTALAKAANVALMGFDVDGILTDGTLYFTSSGDEMKAFNTLDGHGIKMLAQAGIQVAIISGRSSRALELRAANLGIDLLLMGVDDKLGVLRGLLDRFGLDANQAGYMGDDVVDLPIMGACGFSATVPDGHALVARYADHVTTRPGGRGAVREVCELILQAQGKLDAALVRYLVTVQA